MSLLARPFPAAEQLSHFGDRTEQLRGRRREERTENVSNAAAEIKEKEWAKRGTIEAGREVKNTLLFSSETREGGTTERESEKVRERESSTLQCAMLLTRIRSIHQPL